MPEQAVKAGAYLKGLVALVGGSTSGFAAVIGAYVTTITATIAIVAVCLAFGIAMYAMRADQKLRQDLAYGGAPERPGMARMCLCTTRIDSALKASGIKVACWAALMGSACGLSMPRVSQSPMSAGT